MSIGINRSEELRKLYVEENRDTIWIANNRDYANPNEVADELKKNNIPLRPDDVAKTNLIFQKQFNEKDSFSGYQFKTATTIYSEKKDIQNYRHAQIAIGVTSQGTITGTALGITFQISFKDNPKQWYDIADTAVASLSIAAADIPCNKAYTIDRLGGDYFRVKLTSSGSLTTANFIQLNNIIGSFFGN